MPNGTQTEVLTPGQNEKRYLAGGWDVRTGVVHYGCGPRKTMAWFRDLLDTWERPYPARRYDRVSLVVDNDTIHPTPAVGRGLAVHARFQWRWLPTYGPRASPIERVFGDTHDNVTRHHKRKRWRDLITDGGCHLERNGPWLYHLSTIYQEPDITAALKKLKQRKRAA